MNVYFDIFFKNDKIIESQSIFKANKAEILKSIGCKEEEDVLFYVFGKRPFKRVAHFFLKDKYVRAFYGKKKLVLKSKSELLYSNLRLNNVVGDFISGYAFEIQINKDEKFNLNYEYDSEKDIIKDILSSYLNAIRQISLECKGDGVKVPNDEQILSGEASIKRGEHLAINVKAYNKNLEFFENNRKGFLNTVGNINRKDLIYIETTKLLGMLDMQVFTKDKIVVVSTNKNFSKVKHKEEFLYEDIDNIEVGTRIIFNKFINFTDVILLLKKGGKNIINLEVDITPLINAQTTSQKLEDNYNTFNKILKIIVNKSKLQPSVYYDKIIESINNDWENVNSEKYAEIIKKDLINLLILSFKSEQIEKQKLDILFKDIDTRFHETLIKLKEKSEEAIGDEFFLIAQNVQYIAEMKSYIKKMLVAENETVNNYSDIDINFLKSLYKKMNKTSSSLSSAKVYAADDGSLDGIIVSSIYKGIKKAVLINYVKKWVKNELQTEIDNIEKS